MERLYLKPPVTLFAILAVLALGVLAPLSGASGSPGPPSERTFAPVAGEVTAPPAGAVMRDRILQGKVPAAKRLLTAERPMTAPDGSVVHVGVTSYYAPDEEADQAYVDFLGSLTHGSELNGLRMMIVGPTEIQLDKYCGGQAVACYDPATKRIFVVGESSYLGVPTNFALAHEYGHHIARSRRNTPFPGGALNWGTKRWASEQRICPLASQRRLFPTNPNHYWDSPGESMAEEYAMAHVDSGSSWQYTALLTPDSRSTAALIKDVVDPWKGPSVSSYSGSVRYRHTGSVRLSTPFDGTLKLKLAGPPGTDFDLYLYSHGRLIGRSRKNGSSESITATVCGQRRLSVQVYAYRGSGDARLRVSTP